MKNVNLKAVAYSLLMSAFYLVVVLILERHGGNYIGCYILFALFFISMIIIMWNNRPIIFYFWKGHNDFLTPADRIFMVFLGIVIYISGRYTYEMYNDEGTIHVLACLMCLSAAFSFKRVYLNHAPDDIEQYEADRKRDEEVNSYVTVAECKDVESARIIKNLLESNGIEATTYGESSPEFLGNVPVRVIVRKKDKEAAEKLINE